MNSGEQNIIDSRETMVLEGNYVLNMVSSLSHIGRNSVILHLGRHQAVLCCVLSSFHRAKWRFRKTESLSEASILQVQYLSFQRRQLLPFRCPLLCDTNTKQPFSFNLVIGRGYQGIGSR